MNRVAADLVPATRAGASVLFCVALAFVGLHYSAVLAQDEDLQAVRKLEQARSAVIQQVIGSVIAIYGDDREGGGSGVIIDPSGLALTNHHVIQGAGVEGWGGLADGKLYRWTLIGTDPGGDIALIQMEGRDSFPHAPLGDSDQVRVGDWAMAMGNPFVLTEDETPTVTMGIVSGVNRFQEGAGSNQLIYGNCIQVDSSINPGNSGGPLFNMKGEVIGINGRGSFEERGRVNVGLGYAISSNQIKNFIPDLMATKIAEHGTLDATFDMREGNIVCASLAEESAAQRAGLELGDRLIAFEKQPIHSVNQYLNIICTLPEGWTAELQIEKKDGSQKTLYVVLYGLPYNFEPPAAPETPDDPDHKPTPEEKRALERREKMIAFMSADPGSIRDEAVNKKYADWIVARWRESLPIASTEGSPGILVRYDVRRESKKVGTQEMRLSANGRFLIAGQEGDETFRFGFDGENFWTEEDGRIAPLTLVEAKTTPEIVYAMTIAANHQAEPFAALGTRMLDGSDKAQNRLACRLRFVDSKQDWFYCWVSLFDASGKLDVRPLRSSSNLHEQLRGATVNFENWDRFDGWHLPRRASFVSGWDEKVGAEIQLVSHELLDSVDDSLFQMPDAGGEAP